MNNSDVFEKSDLGREEIKAQNQGVLPREARTLLILIDGKKTYERYLATLDKSKIFVETGGVAPLFELLQDLQYIELTEPDNVRASQPPPSLSETQVRVDPRTLQSQPVQSQAPQPRSSSKAEFEAEFDSTPSSRDSNKASSMGSYFKNKETNINYETIKSDLATYIERNAPAQDAWGYLLSLEQCNDDSQLLALIQKIQNSTSGSLSRGMDKFYKAIQR